MVNRSGAKASQRRPFVAGSKRNTRWLPYSPNNIVFPPPPIGTYLPQKLVLRGRLRHKPPHDSRAHGLKNTAHSKINAENGLKPPCRQLSRQRRPSLPDWGDRYQSDRNAAVNRRQQTPANPMEKLQTDRAGAAAQSFACLPARSASRTLNITGYPTSRRAGESS